MFSSLFKRPMALPSWRWISTAAVLSSAAFGMAAPSLAQSAWSSYQANPNAHSNIPNCSYAGYYYGEKALPSAANNQLPDGTVLPVVNVKTSFGAVGDGVADDTLAIKNAIAAVGTTYPNGAVLYFPNGTYILSGQLKVTNSNTILRGQSRDGTIFRFTKSLADLGIGSNWWYSGGLVAFEKSWTQTYPTYSFVSYPVRGATTLNITNANQWAVGDLMKIVVKESVTDGTSLAKHLLGDGTWADGWFNNAAASADSGAIKGTGHAVIQYVEVTGVNTATNTLTLKQPLRFDLRSSWVLSLRKVTGTLRNVGLESVTLSMARAYQWFPQDHDTNERGWNGVLMDGVRDGFLRDLKIVDMDGLGVLMSNSKNVTATGVTLTASAPNRARHHHAFMMGNTVQDCLVENFDITSWPLHGLNLDQWACGNVYSNGRMAHGTFDYHKKLPFDNIITEIEIVNDGLNSGPGGGGPQMGARNAHWNINGKAAGNAIVLEAPKMPRGALVGVYGLPLTPLDSPKYGATQTLREMSGYAAGKAPNPGNLYQAQKALRLGQSIPGAGTTGTNPSYTVRPYDFEFSGGSVGGDIEGQDGWRLWDAWAKLNNGVPMARLVSDTTHPEFPGGTRVLTAATSSVDGRVQRQNNLAWHFIPFQGTETDGRIEFDLKDKAALTISGLGDSIRFGVGWSGAYLSGPASATASFPSPVAATDWLRLQLRLNFTANSGSGSASLYYRNLSKGDTTFAAVPGIQNINLNGNVSQVYTWDTITANVYGNSMMDNILVNSSTNGTVVNAQPTVSLTAPTNNATYTAPATINLTATASDPDGSISKVEFFRGTTKLGESLTAPYTFTWSNAASGVYSLTAKATSDNGVTATSTAVSVTVNAAPAGTGTGLKGEYFSNATFTTLLKTQTDATINFNWGAGGPTNTDGSAMSSVGVDYFSVRWTGQIQAVEGGLYTIAAVADDTAKIWINDLSGTPVVNQTAYNSGNPTSGTYNMTAGQKYNIKIDFTEAAGGARMHLYWTRPGASSAIVPKSQLFPTLALADRTSETGGVITARGENLPNEGKEKAFDNNTGTKWFDYSPTSWLQYQFANSASRVVTRYTLTSGNDSPDRDPKNWTLQGSDNGSTFFNLDTRSNESFSSRNLTRTFEFSNNIGYKMYRLNITSNTNGTTTQLSEMRLLGP